MAHNMNNFNKGEIIYNNIISNTQIFDNIILKNAFIEFYGHFKHIDKALLIFASINDGQKNTGTINAIIKSLIPNPNAFTMYNKYYQLTDDISHM